MYRYNRYIMKHVASATALVALSLTSIIWLTQALRFIEFIVNRGISIASFLELTLLLIPSLLLFVLPFGTLCAVLFIYYRLMMDSELLVLSSAGLSRLQLVKPAVHVAFIVSVLTYLISLWLLPVSYHAFKDMQAYLRDNYASLLLQEEVFNSPVDGLTVYVRERDPDGTLHGIIVHDSRDEHKPPTTMMAEEGKLERTAQGPRFILFHGNRQEVENGKLSFLKFDQYTLDLSFYASDGSNRIKQPEEMYLNELLFPNAEGEQAARLIAEGHNRITWPLFPIALTLLALAVLLTGEFNRRGKWQRVTVAVMLAGITLSGSVGLLNLSVKHPWMIALMYGNVIGMIGASLFVIGHEVSHRPVPEMLKEA
jgi:lipopolysaccharide export system permease protein